MNTGATASSASMYSGLSSGTVVPFTPGRVGDAMSGSTETATHTSLPTRYAASSEPTP